MVTEDDVRRIALSLPATTEKPSYGTPGFRVKDKLRLGAVDVDELRELVTESWRLRAPQKLLTQLGG